jgi:nucleoside-diphosphate-sugar epimerase
MTQTLLIAGATGWLGRKIAEEAQSLGANVKLLLRGGAAHPKAESLSALTAKGATILPGDLDNEASLQTATRGVDVVISAVQGGPETILDGQLRLANAAKANGARRIFPSDFAATYKHLSADEHPFLNLRAQADAAIERLGLPQTNTVNGGFMETMVAPFMGMADFDNGVFRHWGDAGAVYDLTHTDDVGAFVAHAALDPKSPVGDFRIVGQTISPREIAETASRVLGRKIQTQSWGSAEALDAEIAKRRAAAPHDPNQWIALMYHRLIISEGGRVRDTHNHLYPSVKPKTVEAFLRGN